MLTAETLAELRRLLAESGYNHSEPLRDWMMGHLAGRTHAHLVDGAVNALPDLLDAAADRDALRAERDALLAIIDDARHALSADGPKVEPARQALARALPQITAWQDRKRRDRDITPPHVIAHRGAQLDAVTAERDALAAKLGVVREWIDRRGVDVGDRDDDYMRGYRAAQRHALHDAVDLRHALDADNLDPEPACLIHDVSGEDVRGWEMAECTCPTVRTLDGEARP